MATVLTSYYRPKPSGLCKRLFMAIQALLDSGHTVHYLAVEPFPIVHGRCVFHRFRWPADKTDTLLFWAVFHLAAPLQLAWIALRWRITHVFGFSAAYAFLLKPAAWVRGIEPTCFLHADVLAARTLNQQPRWLALLERWIEGLALWRSRAVGLHAALVETIVGRHCCLKPRQTALLPNDLPAGGPHGRKPRQPLCIGMVGALAAGKNHAFAIDVMAGFSKDKVRLCLFGRGPLQSGLERRVRALGCARQIRFMGWVPSQRIWPRLDLLLMPSLHEGMPEAVLEAVANGVPVLASDIPGHRAILPAGHLLPLGRKDPWRSELSRLLADPGPLLRGMAEEQHRYAQQLKFDWSCRVVDFIVGC